MSYEAQLYCQWVNGMGLPVPFHDLPITISHILIAIQNDFDMEAADLAEGAKGTLTL